MTNRTMHINVPMKVFKTLGNMFWTANGGASYLLTNFYITYKQRLRTLKDVFEPRELLLILDSLKTVDKFPEHIPAGRFLFDTINYQIEENRYAIKWDINPEPLLDKVSSLKADPFTAMCFSLWAWAFSHTNSKPRDEYVKELL